MKEAFPGATIIRPAETFGHEDRYFNYYAKFRMVAYGTVPLSNYGLNIYKYPVYVSMPVFLMDNGINDDYSISLESLGL